MKKVLIILSILISSCFNDEPPAVDKVEGGTFNQTCNMDAEKIKLILDQNIFSEIDCIRLNLEQFTDFVRRKDQRYIHRDELSKFIKKFFPDAGDSMLESLDLFFDFSALVLRDPKDNISVENMSNLFVLLKKFNAFGVPLKKHFVEISEQSNYWEKREQVKSLLQGLIQSIETIILKTDGPATEIDTYNFVGLLKRSMNISDDVMDMELIRDLLFIKPLFLGGDERSLNSDEIIGFIQKLYPILSSGLDLFFVKDLEVISASQNIGIILDTVRSAKNSLFPHPGEKVIATHQKMLRVIDKTLSSVLPFNIYDVEETIINAKKNIISVETKNANEYKMSDMNRIFSWGEELLERLYFNSVTWSYYIDDMEGEDPITSLSFVDLPEYEALQRTKIFDYWNDYLHITKTFRTFQTPSGLQYFTNEYKRHLNGFNIISGIRFGLQKFLVHYGHAVFDPQTGKEIARAANQNDIRQLLLDFRSALVTLEVWPKYFERFVGEAATGCDLFQFMSNGDGVANLDEAVSYVNNIFSGSNVATKLFDELKNYCDVVEDEDGNDAYLVSCYRQYFFQILFEDLNYRQFYQKLYDYTVFYSAEEIMEYLINIERASKEERDEAIPMSKVDLGRLFATFSSVESTMLHFDADKDNILHYEEAMQAFSIFKKTLVEFSGLKESQEKLVQSVYLYILKKMKVPSTLELLWFHAFGKKKNIEARRMNIGSIFALISAQTLP